MFVSISGGNNDIGRMQEIKEKSLFMKDCFIISSSTSHNGLEHYVNFLDEVLGPNDDITTFEYTKKNNKESGPGLVGIELKEKMTIMDLFKE